jgi:hypothetical protein
MMAGTVRQPRLARLLVAALLMLSVGCASGQGAAGPGPGPAHTSAAAASPTPQPTPGRSEIRALAAAYMAIARPANHRLDHSVDGFGDSIHGGDLAAANADLGSQAGTERWFDRRLLKIQFPAAIEAVATALTVANQRRITLTELEARSTSLAELRSFTARHRAADAAVEVYVREIRRLLGLPPPSTS